MHKLGSSKSWNRKAALLCYGACLELFALVVAEYRIYRPLAAPRSLQCDCLRFPRFRGIQRCQADQQVKESAREGLFRHSEYVENSKFMVNLYLIIIIIVLLNFFLGEFKLLVANCLNDSKRVKTIVDVFLTLSFGVSFFS